MKCQGATTSNTIITTRIIILHLLFQLTFHYLIAKRYSLPVSISSQNALQLGWLNNTRRQLIRLTNHKQPEEPILSFLFSYLSR